MTSATRSKKSTIARRGQPLFEVTVQQTIGSIFMSDDEGDLTPSEAAFVLIARHHRDTNGDLAEYRFPGGGEGETVIVAVGTEKISRDQDQDIHYNNDPLA